MICQRSYRRPCSSVFNALATLASLSRGEEMLWSSFWALFTSPLRSSAIRFARTPQERAGAGPDPEGPGEPGQPHGDGRQAAVGEGGEKVVYVGDVLDPAYRL